MDEPVKQETRWTAEQLIAALKKAAGKEEKPVDKSPNRGSSWMGR